MKTNELRPQDVKEPRTVKMYHVVYSVSIFAALVIGLIAGHMLTKAYEGQVREDAAQLSQAIVKNVQVKAEVAPSK